MTAHNSLEYAKYVAQPRQMQIPGAWGGAVEMYQATITLNSQADGDTINLFVLPKGFIPVYGMLHTPTLGSSTIAIGIAGSTGKYRASAVHTAVIPTLFGVVGSMDGVPLSAEELVFITNTTAALPSSGKLNVRMFGALR